jgi:hypothetical protein
MTNPTPRELIQRLTGALGELRDLIPAIMEGSYEPDSFTLQPLESAIQDVSIALAQPEPEGVPDAEALMAAWDSAISKPRMGRLAEYRTWLAYALSLVWAVNRVQTQPEPLSDKELTDMACAVDLVADMGDEQFASPYREDSDIKAEVLAFARVAIAADRARYARPAIEPVSEVLTDEAIEELTWRHTCEIGDLGVGIAVEDAPAFIRAALARWGRPTIKPVPVAERLPGCAHERFEFSVFDSEYEEQAGGTAPTYAQALSEGQHYLAMYSQDGSHSLELRRVEVLIPDALPVPGAEANHG